MSEPKILNLLQTSGVRIEKGTISNLLIKNKDQFHNEKADIIKAGILSTEYQQTDHTHSRVKGENWNTQVVCNPLYTAFITTRYKNRLSVLEILMTGAENNGDGLQYVLNNETYALLKELNVSKKYRYKLKLFLSDTIFTKELFIKQLEKWLPGLKNRIKARILEASAIAGYHNQDDYPIIKILVTDDAPVFRLLTEGLSLCWIHEGRHYKKLSPIFPYYVKRLKDFIKEFWEYYDRLLEYKRAPSEDMALKLSNDFDKLFSTKTGYDMLDDRISKTAKKKDRLLLVLKYPFLPLHNNESELGARVTVRKRDVSLHTMSDEGTMANDTFLTIIETCKKLGVNSFDYILDRIKKTNKFTSLAELIIEKSKLEPCFEFM